MFLLYSKMKREMKNFLLKWKKPLLWLTGFVLLVLCWQVWDGLFDAGLALAAIVPGMSGGKIVSNEPLTTDIVREGSPSLLRSEVDKRIVKIRPMSTPIDQLSRWNGSRKASSMIVDYYSVDVKPTKSYMKASYVAPGASTVNDSHKKENVMLTGGIWWQAGNHYTYNPTVEMTQNDLIDMMRQAFTGNGGNKRKVLIGGSSFIGRINKIEMTKVVMSREDKVQWGIDFSEIKSKFGKLYVLYSEVFDDCGMSDYGFIFDPEFIQKWSHVPFDSQELDLKKSGVRNTDALVLTEASCLTLRYPAAHMRIEPVIPDEE